MNLPIFNNTSRTAHTLASPLEFLRNTVVKKGLNITEKNITTLDNTTHATRLFTKDNAIMLITRRTLHNIAAFLRTFL